MASSEAPQPTAADNGSSPHLAPTESEPLLGRPGDAMQKPDDRLIKNLWLGTAPLAQLGILVLTLLVLTAVATHPLYPLVSPHPILQALGLFTLTQAILILQPTHTPTAKLLGQRAHAALHLLSFLLFAAGVSVIEANKIVSNGEHFHSLHGYLGVLTASSLVIQYLFGFAMWAVPAVFGGVEQAKAKWKYHRYAGYGVFVLALATVLSAVETPYNKAGLEIKMWSAGLAVALVVVGVFPRVQLAKLGIQGRAR
ncbi:eukaryotic cytochrome b561-domain-containing protein [Bombardia bombarda]|uniref:Eukaryotic cytochrome b561-domain-containing protein n=1 Tax=Bombardia bombarda TaxID=252184 RepID=A0AA40CET4_9PEZI|nr:eukaryotic cytochrome b561-domain-containing protein [Bombardia bombarda]